MFFCYLYQSYSVSSVLCECRTGDNESLMLLCDNCDRGTHTYCCKPKLESIPEGDWYCHDCVINVSPTKLFISVARRTIPILYVHMIQA